MKSENIDALTGLRGLAAWMVVVYHFREPLPAASRADYFQWFDLGYLAVDLFFILSGLVLYINYHQNFVDLRSGAALSFYLKRIARVYPLHLAILILFIANPVAIILFSSSGDPGARYSIEYFVMSVFMVQNWGFTPWVEWNIPAWSISTEFAAYLLFPLLVVAIKRGARIGRAIPPGMYLCLLLAIAVLYPLNDLASLGHGISRVGIFRCVLEFSMGLILGYYYVLDPGRIQRMATGFFALFCLVLLAVIVLGPVRDYLVAPLLFTLLILALLDGRAPWSRLLAVRPLIFLGEISYSTYMIHYFVKDWTKFLSNDLGLTEFVVYISVVFVMSIVLYRLIELPFRSRLYARFSRFTRGGPIAQ